MGQGKLVAPSDAPKASPREKEPCMRLGRAYEMVQRIPCSLREEDEDDPRKGLVEPR